MRAVALSVAPVRRLHEAMQDLDRCLTDMTGERDALVQHSARARDLEHLLVHMTDERDALGQQQSAESSKAKILAEKPETLELQLSVLRSDLERVASRNRQLCAALHASGAPSKHIASLV